MPSGNGIHHEHPLREITDSNWNRCASHGQRHRKGSGFFESGP